MDNQEIYFNLNPVNFLIISGLLQNFIVCGILFFNKGDHPVAGKLLSATVFIVTLHLTYLMLLDLNLDNMFPVLLRIPYSFLTAIGPLIFLYTSSLTDIGFRISAKHLKHFVPLAIELALQFIQIIYSINHEVMYYNNPFYFILTPTICTFAAGSVFFYLQKSLKLIRKHESQLLKNFSNLQEVTLAWLSRLITYYRLLWMGWTPFITFFLVFFRFQLQYLAIVIILYLLMLIITYLTYWIGIEGIRKMNFVFIKRETSPSTNKNYVNLSKQAIKGYIDKMEQLMKGEQLFLNENLSLRDFSQEIKADPNLVSHILNNHLNKNFYEFINAYRIEEAKKRLSNPKYKHLTILAIALASGFNSKTSFNRVFKQMTGLTPSEFQKKKTA